MRGHLTKLLVISLTALGLAGGLTTLALNAAPSALAATQGTTNNACYQDPNWSNCFNTDPYDTDCNIGSYVANSLPVYWYDSENGQLTGGYSGYIQNWYSPHCGTNWARYVDTSGVAGNVSITMCLNDEFITCLPNWYVSAIFPAWSNQLYARTTEATAFADYSAFNGGGAASGHANA